MKISRLGVEKLKKKNIFTTLSNKIGKSRKKLQTYYYNHKDSVLYYTKESTTELTEDFYIEFNFEKLDLSTITTNITLVGSGNNYISLRDTGTIRVRLSDGSTLTTLKSQSYTEVKKIVVKKEGTLVSLLVDENPAQTLTYTLPSFNLTVGNIGYDYLEQDITLSSFIVNNNNEPVHSYKFTSKTNIIEDDVSSHHYYIRKYNPLNWKTSEGTPYTKGFDFYYDNIKQLEYSYVDNYGYDIPDLAGEYVGDQAAFTYKSWADFYISMHNMTQDVVWLNLLVSLIDKVLSLTDDKKLVAGTLTNLPYSQAPQAVMQADVDGNQTGHIGWSRLWEGGRRVEYLIDAGVCNWIALAVDYIKTNNLPVDSVKVDGYISKCVDILRTHDTSWMTDRYLGQPDKIDIKGSYYYPNTTTLGFNYSHPIPFNHTALGMEATVLLSKYVSIPDLDQKVVEFTEFFVSQLQDFNGSCIWYYSVRNDGTAGAGGYIEDNNHATYDVAFLNRVLTPSQLGKLYKTIDNFVTDNYLAEGVDGLEDIRDSGDVFGYRVGLYRGWLELSKTYNPQGYNTILRHLTKLLNKNLTTFYHTVYSSAARVMLEKGNY